MNIFIIGAERCGKSTAALHLSQALNCEYAETGRRVIRELAKFYAKGSEDPQSVERWAKLIGLHKPEFRKELGLFGDLITGVSPTHLIDECLRRARIVVGVRRRREVLGYFQRYGQGSWKSVWIKIKSTTGQTEKASRYELAEQPCDFEVINDGSPEDLQSKMQSLAQKIQRVNLTNEN